jgi:phage-related protein
VSLSLPPALIAQKNLLASDDPALALLEIDMPQLMDKIRLVANDVDITWDGETWAAFPFEIDNIGEPARGELPSVTIRVSNVSRAIQGYVELADGGVDADVKIRVINGGDLAFLTPYIELDFRVASTTVDENWVTFNLVSIDTWARTFPRNKIIKNNCSYAFKGLHCGYAGVETECDRTLTRCRALNNSERYGGFPGVGYDGLRL